MDSSASLFSAHRPRLFGIAYRMLGSRAEAEDVVQDAYMRWHGSADPDELRSPEAWLVTIVTRLAIDRLRVLKTEREAYHGPWLPEPIASLELPSPERSAELANDVSMALLTVLERLAPEERAAFLLREVFDFDYPEIAGVLGKSQASCRQMVHRAKERVRSERPRFQVSREAHAALLQRFAAAARAGSREQLMALLAEDATLTSDGGGKAVAVTRTLHGADRVARLYIAIGQRNGARGQYLPIEINGEPGLLHLLDGRPDTLISAVTDGHRILDMYVVRNPDKLAPFLVRAGLVTDASPGSSSD